MDPAPQLEPPRHDDPDGPLKGWNAADVPPDAYVDDAWLAAHTAPVEQDGAG